VSAPQLAGLAIGPGVRAGFVLLLDTVV